MKRKTIIIVGLTGVLLTGTALTGIMAAAYLSREKQISISEGVSDGRQYIQAQPAPVLNQAPMPRSRADGEMKVPEEREILPGLRPE